MKTRKLDKESLIALIGKLNPNDVYEFLDRHKSDLDDIADAGQLAEIAEVYLTKVIRFRENVDAGRDIYHLFHSCLARISGRPLSTFVLAIHAQLKSNKDAISALFEFVAKSPLLIHDFDDLFNLLPLFSERQALWLLKSQRPQLEHSFNSLSQYIEKYVPSNELISWLEAHLYSVNRLEDAELCQLLTKLIEGMQVSFPTIDPVALTDKLCVNLDNSAKHVIQMDLVEYKEKLSKKIFTDDDVGPDAIENLADSLASKLTRLTGSYDSSRNKLLKDHFRKALTTYQQTQCALYEETLRIYLKDIQSLLKLTQSRLHRVTSFEATKVMLHKTSLRDKQLGDARFDDSKHDFYITHLFANHLHRAIATSLQVTTISNYLHENFVSDFLKQNEDYWPYDLPSVSTSGLFSLSNAETTKEDVPALGNENPLSPPL